MRGEYQVTLEDRRRFFHALLELCQSQVDKVDLVGTQLCLSNCVDLLEELGYEQNEWETNGWEGEIWCEYTHAEAPSISFSADAYVGGLDVFWTAIDDEEEIEIEAFKNLMRKHWGKYFPAI